MKVAIYETLEVSEEQRDRIGHSLGEDRPATREEMKQFFGDLLRAWDQGTVESPEEEDLIGDPDDDQLALEDLL